MSRDRQFTWKDGDVIVSPCATCKHVFRGKKATPGMLRCSAFPDGVPMVIVLAQFDHKTPFPDDNGIVYERDVKRFGEE